MAAVAEMGEVDEIHSNEESIKDGASVNGDVCDYKEDGDDETMEMNEISTNVSEDAADQDQNLTDNEKSDEDNPSVQLEDEEKSEYNDMDDDMDKMEVEEIINEDSNEQIHEIDNSDVEEEEEEEEEAENNKNKSDVVNGLNNSDEIIIETTSESNALIDNSDKVELNSIVINDSGEGDGDGEDVVVLDDNKDPIENGSIDMSGDDVEMSETTDENHKDCNDAEVINLEDTPLKKKKKLSDSGPPRRSSRNLNREKKSYVEEEEYIEEKRQMQQRAQEQQEQSSEESESDIEEVMPQDPLAVADPPTPQIEKATISKKARMSSSTIVVKDTKCLAEIASKSTANNHNKKEPTLVIIDTNSILSGRGPVPIAQKPALPPTPISNSYSMLPMALPAQGIYPANMRATITPIPMTPPPPPPKPVPPPPPPPPVLPTLTDDMFVVEAPSFIVPYVYEKPPIKELREFVKNLENEMNEQKKKEAECIEKEKKEKQNKEQKDKNKEDESKNDKDKSEGGDSKKSADEEQEKVGVSKDDDKKVVSEKVVSIDSEKENKKGEDKTEKEEKSDTDLPAMPVPSPTTLAAELRKPPATYFDSPLGKFFMGIGYGLVQEAVQSDLLKQQKRRRDRENGQNPETMKTINSLLKNLEFTKENNEPYRMETKKCEFCSFKTESSLAMAFHLETPHMKNYVYRCNFCPYEVRSPHDILFHMEVQHGVRGRLERAPAFHQCPNCPFEDNQKGKLSRHLVACTRKFKPDRNLEPPADYEPPAKIPRAPRMKQQGLGTAAAVYQAMARSSQYQMMSKLAGNLSVMQRGRGRPSLGNTTVKQSPPGIRPTSMLYKQANMSGGSVLVPTNYQLSGNQLYQQQNSLNKMKPVQQPSISITPLPRGSTTPGITITKPGDSNPKNSFVICEICDGYIKDLEQLRNHMQWIHKVKIHPKMIYNRPPLNCQKCQFRFFTDQGLERHLLGSHGLVTSSMQEAANRSKDAGRCPVCGRVYQWKLLNHVARDHNMTLKPAHLSYKCTVCTATFGMYKQFESHVYSAHSVVAKRVMDKKNAAATSVSSASKTESVLKPLKINDEITIIPQPAKPTNGAGKEESTPSTSGTSISVRNSVGYSNGNPGTSKSATGVNEPSSSTSLSRSERLARRKTTSQTDN